MLFTYHKNLPEFHYQNFRHQFHDWKDHLACYHLNHRVNNSVVNHTIHLACCHHIDISVVSSRYYLTKLYPILFPFLVWCVFFHHLRLCLWILFRLWFKDSQNHYMAHEYCLVFHEHQTKSRHENNSTLFFVFITIHFLIHKVFVLNLLFFIICVCTCEFYFVCDIRTPKIIIWHMSIA